MFVRLKKLRGKSFQELRVRGRQEVYKLGERLLHYGTAEMSDQAFLSAIDAPSRRGSGEGISALVLERIRRSLAPALSERDQPAFLPSLSWRDEIPTILLHRFPEQWRAVIERANRAIEGRFDLLGYTDLRFGDPIDWHLEPVSGKRTGLEHWSKI